MISFLNQKFNLLTVIDGPIRKNNKIYWLCQCECGKQKMVRSDELKSGRTKSCGCYKKRVLIEQNKQRQTLDLSNQQFGKLTAISPTNKRTNDGRVIWECVCECGKKVYVDTHSLTQHHTLSCGCLRSQGEEKIRQLLKDNNIMFNEQQSFIDCRFKDTGYLARFDFYVNNQYLIEYDGEQHFYYKNSNHTWNTKENYEKIQKKDQFKNDWCKIHHIPLIRIPYTALKKLTINDLLLDTTKFRIN